MKVWPLTMGVFLLLLAGCWAGAAIGISELGDSDDQKITAPLPTTFNLLFPEDTGTVLAINPSFGWDNAEDESFYIVEVDDDPGFMLPLLYQSPGIPADTGLFTMPTGILSTGITYYWRVVAYSLQGSTEAQNGPRSFSITISPHWARMYGGIDRDSGLGILPRADGAHVIYGETSSFGIGSEDYWLLKLNPDKSVNWARTYGGGGQDIPRDFIETSEGSYLLCGDTWSFGLPGGGNLWVIKTTPDGLVTWQRAYTKTAVFTNGEALVETSDGGYVVAGKIFGEGAGNSDLWVIKIAADGAIVWQRAFGHTDSEFAYDIATTQDNGFVVVGRTQSFGVGGNDLWVMKLGSDGSLIWNYTYGGPDDEYGRTVTATSDGGFLVGGVHELGPAPSDVRPWAMKLDATGLPSWQKYYGNTGGGGAELKSAYQTSDGGYIVAASRDSFARVLFKIDGAGAVVWAKNWSVTGGPGVMALKPAPDGGILIADRRTDFSPNPSVAVFRFEADGSLPTISTTIVLTDTNTGLVATSQIPIETITTVTTQEPVLPTDSTPVVSQLAP